MLAIPYTHSGVLASALAMDKPMAKRVFAQRRPALPGRRRDHARAGCWPSRRWRRRSSSSRRPKGSSVGVVIVLDDDLRALTDRNDVDPDCRLLVERYVPGRELTCAVLGDEPLAVTEIRPNDGFYDYRAKYTEGFASHLVPAPLSPDLYEQVMEAALVGAPRARLPGRQPRRLPARPERRATTGLYLLEVNTQPGMTPLSLVPEQAAYRGIAFPDLVVRLVEWARCDR